MTRALALAVALLLAPLPAWAVPVTVRAEVTVRVPVTVHEPVSYSVPVVDTPTLVLPGPAEGVYGGGLGEDQPLSHTPEPATLLLLGSALAAAGWRIRRGR